MACNSDSSSGDAGDATTEPPIDICTTFTFVGDHCAHASTAIVCFPVCEAGGGCSCKATDAGPEWECFTPPECTSPCGNTSPLVDSGDCDASDGSAETGTDDAGDAGAGSDASDASTDG